MKSSQSIKTTVALFLCCLSASASDFGVTLSARPETLHLGDDPIRVKLAVSAKDPERFLNALMGVQLQILGEGIAEKFRLTGATELESWSWTPVKPGNYRLRLSALTPGGYPISARSEVNVISPDIAFSSPVVVPFGANKTFDVTIPIPEIPFPLLDIGFLIDISASMDGEILAFKNSAAAIFESLKSVSSSPLASVITFSHVQKNPSGLLEPENYSLTIPPTPDAQVLREMQLTTTGGNESSYYALHYASQLEIFRPDSLRILLLMTDEIDNVYSDQSDRELMWHPAGKLSPSSILSDLKSNHFCVGIVHSELTDDQARLCYTDIMAPALQEQFAGSHPLSLSSNDTANRIISQIQNALTRLIGQTQLFLKLARPENSEWLTEIQPLAPAHCISGNGFNLGQLRANNISEMTFRLKLSDTAPRSPQHFFIEGSTDKGTVNHTIPIVLSN